LSEGTSGLLLGDHKFWSSLLKETQAQRGIDLLASFRRSNHDPWPQRRYLLSRWRYRIDTIFSLLVEHTGLKRLWARDTWHLWNRLLRKVLQTAYAGYNCTNDLADLNGDNLTAANSSGGFTMTACQIMVNSAWEPITYKHYNTMVLTTGTGEALATPGGMGSGCTSFGVAFNGAH
jgi:hypothetical protein